MILLIKINYLFNHYTVYDSLEVLSTLLYSSTNSLYCLVAYSNLICLIVHHKQYAMNMIAKIIAPMAAICQFISSAFQI